MEDATFRPPQPSEPPSIPRDLVTSLYLRSDRAATLALQALKGCFDGLWLGVLSRDQLARIDQDYYSRAGQYLSESYNRAGLWGWESTAIDRHFDGVRRVVITSAGAGREVLALAKAGYEVSGFEPHEGLVRFGNDLLCADGVDATLSTCERDGWPSAALDADGAVVGWGGYMLIPGRERRVAFLRQAAACLPDDAPVLLSFYARCGAGVRFRVSYRLANLLRRVLRRPAVSAGDALVPTMVHFFTRAEVAQELADAGFEMVDFGAEDYGWAVGRVRHVARER